MAKALTIQQQVMQQVMALAQSGQNLDVAKVLPELNEIKVLRDAAIESAKKHGGHAEAAADSFFARVMGFVDHVRQIKLNVMAAVAAFDSIMPGLEGDEAKTASTVNQYQRKARQVLLESGNPQFAPAILKVYGVKKDEAGKPVKDEKGNEIPAVPAEELQFSGKTTAEVQKILTAVRSVKSDQDLIAIGEAIKAFSRYCKLAPRKVAARVATATTPAKVARNAIPSARVLEIIGKAQAELLAEYEKARDAAARTVQEPAQTAEEKARLANLADKQQTSEELADAGEGIQAPGAPEEPQQDAEAA